MIKKYWFIALAILIVVVGSIIRFADLNNSPPSLGFDEASLGYNAYSILLTGKDEYGVKMPISLRSFNDYKPALYAYLIIPFIKLWGLTAQAVRTPSAMAGTVSLIFLFLFLNKFIKTKWKLLLIFFVLSFEPWRLHFSRNAFETHLSSMFFLMAMWFLFEAKSRLNLFWSVILFGLSAYSYHSARLAAPLVLFFWALDPILWFENNKFEFKKERFLPLIFFIVLCVPIFMANSGGLVLTRLKQENIFGRYYPFAPKEVLSIPGSMIYYFLGIIFGHMSSVLSPINLSQRIYLWVKESPQFIPGMGMIGRLESIFFIFGFGYLLKNIKKSKDMRLILYWIVSGAAPAALTWTWYHPLRSLNIFPAVEILAAIGMYLVFDWIFLRIKSNLIKLFILGCVIVVILTSTVFRINNELLYSAVENMGEYQPGGFREGMELFKSLQDNYDQIIIDTPHAQGFVFLFFYQSFDPKIIQSYANIRPKPGTEGNLNFNFGKFIFRKIDWPRDRNLKRTLFWGSSDITKSEIENTPGAKLQKIVKNSIYDTAVIITTE